MCFPYIFTGRVRNGIGFLVGKSAKLKPIVMPIRYCTAKNPNAHTHCQMRKDMQKEYIFIWNGKHHHQSKCLCYGKSLGAVCVFLLFSIKAIGTWIHIYTHTHDCQLNTHTIVSSHGFELSENYIRGERTLLILRYTVFTVFRWA